jgi:Fur family transcriptional regulator, iron response regulator
MSKCNVLIADARLQAKLQEGGLRLTRPRVALCRLLFAHGPRHLTAKHLYSEARDSGLTVSLPTVQRTLRCLGDLGMIRKLATGRAEHVFDTDPSEHHHVLLEQDGTLIDVRHGMGIADLPPLPPGTRVKQVDVIIRLERDP